MIPELRYVVPVHNDETILATAVRTLVSELSRRAPSEGAHHVLLLENGSSDRSYEMAKSLAGVRDGVHVHAFEIPAAGLGHAYARGIAESLAIGGDPTRHWQVLTASDLPFEFTDLDAFERWLPSAGPRTRMVVGSKAHPESRIQSSAVRATTTFLYRLARQAILGMRTKDSQGSFFIRGDLAQQLHDRVVSRDFFYTTELVHFAERDGEQVTELPIRLAPARRPSTVRPFKHGSQMLRALLSLRARTR